jgi:sialic acid synthase SpsE
VAEIGHNWIPYGFSHIQEFIAMVSDSGWDIAKFQLYDTDKIKQPGDTNYQELKDAELTYEKVHTIKRLCDDYKVEFCASAFDSDRVQWLEALGVKRHKLASRCIHDDATIQAMIRTKKQVIASLGNWTIPLFPKYKLDYLYCKTRRQILQDGFSHSDLVWALENGYAGFSDHTIGNEYALIALDRGAKIIEKHITINKNAAGWDMPSSADFNDMLEIVKHRR